MTDIILVPGLWLDRSRETRSREEAARCYRQALPVGRAAGDRYFEAGILTRLGDNRHAVGDLDAAHRSWSEALSILDELGHPDADQLRRKLRQLERTAGPRLAGARTGGSGEMGGQVRSVTPVVPPVRAAAG